MWLRRVLKLVFPIAAAVICVAAICAREHTAVTESHIKAIEIKVGRGIEIRPIKNSRKAARDESFSEMMSRLHPYAAMNGTYYDDALTPLGDILVNGKLINHGKYPNAIAVDKNGRLHMIRRKAKAFDWSGYVSGLAAGPVLVHKGRVSLHPEADGFRPASLRIKASRSGVGITRSGNLLLVTVAEQITLSQFAQILIDHGAVEAMNLDGGPACALYHNGRILATPGLPMTNLLLVYKKNR